MSTHLPLLTIRQVNRLISAGLVTSEQVCRYCHALAAAGEEVWHLGAFQNLLPLEAVVEQARISDERRRSRGGRTLSLLEGIPVSIKSNLAVENIPLTAGSRILGAAMGEPQHPDDDNGAVTPPVGYNAAITRALLSSGSVGEGGGGVLIGQTAMDEFGMGSLGTNRRGRPTRNPLSYLNHFPPRRILDDHQVAKILVTISPEDILEVHECAALAVVASSSSSPSIHDGEHGYSAGGSSSGAAASVAHGSSLLAVGSDTGGSVRLPAAWCSVVGLKPTYGVLSRHGLVSYASSLDTIGMLAPTAHCLQLAFRHVLQSQRLDQDSTVTRLPPEALDCEDEVLTGEQPLQGFRVGIPSAFHVAECPEEVRSVWIQTADRLKELGACVTVVGSDAISPEVLQQSLASYYLLACAEASSNLARYDGVRYGCRASATTRETAADGKLHDDRLKEWSFLERQFSQTRSRGFGPEVKRRVICGTYVLSSDKFHTHYEAAATIRAILARQLHRALEVYDCLLVPTALSPPVSLQHSVDPTSMIANDVMTVAVSLAGLPSVAMPCGPTASSTLARPSFQLIGPRLGEGKILQAALALERSFAK